MLLMLAHFTKFIILGLMGVFSLTVIEGISMPTTSAQSNNATGDLPTALEELKDENFALITVNIEQIEEIRSTVNSTRQAVENGNMTEALIRLRALDQQLELVAERTSPFGD